MAGQEDKIIGRRLKSSYISTVVSITLVLFVLGLLGLIILQAQKLSEQLRERIVVSVFINDHASDVEIGRLQSQINSMPAVRETTYITRDEAAQRLMNDIGEDFIEFLGYNPLSASVQISLLASYANPDSMQVFEAEVRRHSIVSDVDYQKSLVHLVNENLRRIGAGLLAFSVLLLIIAFALINNTIRLSVFSKRFLIKSMQLVGATQSFIRKPFIVQGMVQGVIGASIAISLLIATMYAAEQQIPEMAMLYDTEMLAILLAGVLVLGIILSYISTFFAVRKYLKIKTDHLYLY